MQAFGSAFICAATQKVYVNSKRICAFKISATRRKPCVKIYTHSLTHTTVGDKMAAGAAAHERSQGDKALMEGKLAVALKHFEKAVQMNGDDHLNWYKRATAYIIEKRYDAALKDLGKVIEMKADYAQAYDKRAKIFTSQGMCNKARIVQQKLRQLQALLAAGVLY